MKKPPEQIIQFAEQQVKSRGELRFHRPVAGLVILISAIWLVRLFVDKQSKLETSLLTNSYFVLGFAFAVLAVLTLGLGAALLATATRELRDIDALELLLQLWKERGQPSDPSNPHSPSAQGSGGR